MLIFFLLSSLQSFTHPSLNPPPLQDRCAALTCIFLARLSPRFALKRPNYSAELWRPALRLSPAPHSRSVYRGHVKGTFTWVRLSLCVAPANERATVGMPEHTLLLRPPTPHHSLFCLRYVIRTAAMLEPRFTITMSTTLPSVLILNAWTLNRLNKKL